jgi:glyoxylase-like metal-dependent hydrolase (beta-lactamase superfamily II)
MTRLILADAELFSFVENRCYLDGGSMYGVIPKIMWEQHASADAENRIPLDTNVVLIRLNGRIALVDCGLGDRTTKRERKIYGCETPSRLEDTLAQLGVDRQRVDFVIATHLHLDHIGGAFEITADGEFEPRFPNARHIFRKTEWLAALNPDDRSRASYPSDRLLQLEQTGLVALIEEDCEIFPGVRVELTGGHTAGHQAVFVSVGDATVAIPGDIIPTSGHLRPTYIAASDLFPLDTLEYKKRLLNRIVDGGWIVAFDHDTQVKFARIKLDGGRYSATPVGELVV